MEKDWDENRRVKQYRLFDLPGIMRPGILCNVLEELILKIEWWKLRSMLSRNCISENSETLVTFNVGGSFLGPKSVQTRLPQLTMSWINAVEMAWSTDDLITWQWMGEMSFPDFEILDARIASALRKIIFNASGRRRFSVEQQSAPKQNRFLRGRQIAYMIYDFFKATGTYDAGQGLSDLFNFAYRMTTFRISIQSGTNSIRKKRDTSRGCLCTR